MLAVDPHTPHDDKRTAMAGAAVLAAAAPSLLAFNLAPSPTFLNQALAFGLWGVFVALQPAARSLGAARELFVALGLIAVAAAWSTGVGGLPASLALSSIGALVAAAVMVASGAGAGVARRRDAPAAAPHRTGSSAAPALHRPGSSGAQGSSAAVAAERADAAVDVFVLFCWAWLVAGVLNSGVAVVQVFLPHAADGDWIASSGLPGRAVGNLRQPNHLSSLLLWSCIATAALADLGRLRRGAAAVAMATFVFAVVLTASRTGLVSVLALGGWALADRRLARPTRALLLAAPVGYAVSWWGMSQWAALSRHSFGGAARLAETDISGSRFDIWADSLALIRDQPWAGVGWGEFNFAWSLTPLPGRPTAFFDHAHNLPLHLAVELGLPLAGLVGALFAIAAWRAARGAWAAPAALGNTRRSAAMMVAMIGLHSLLEYPLWYAYFLLPAAWAWGYALSAGQGDDAWRLPVPWRADGGASRGVAWAGVALAAGAVLSVADYRRVALIFEAPDAAAPLAQRIADGQRSVLFAHHADYAAATVGFDPTLPPDAFDRAVHYLLDTRLMTAWARDLAARGDLDRARHLAQRLREFRRPESDPFFEPCERADADAAPPFQCTVPARPHVWRDFLPR